jgi:hypothetical protein
MGPSLCAPYDWWLAGRATIVLRSLHVCTPITPRSSQVYTRLKSAFAAHKAEAAGRGAAGAVAAAARELRPVEIVGVYEQQREGLELEASRLRAEVRSVLLWGYLHSDLCWCWWMQDRGLWSTT